MRHGIRESVVRTDVRTSRRSQSGFDDAFVKELRAMISYYAVDSLVAQRRDTLLAEAAADRLARRARSHHRQTRSVAVPSPVLRWVRALLTHRGQSTLPVTRRS
jgi:hypothetical protein